MAEQKGWDLKSADDVAQALDWVRRRMKGNGLVLIAIGVNSVAVSKDAKLPPHDAAEVLERQLPTIRREFARLQSHNKTRGFAKRED
jgi:hypothetical protein